MDNYLPPKYDEMKALARQGAYYEREAVIFYRQAMLMAQHEDDCPYTGQLLRYYPTYRTLTDAQLRGYFTWRTNVRKGTVEKTALSFVYIYIYELLCLVGVQTPEEAFDKLCEIGHRYSAIDPSVGRYLRTWLQDFYVYYQPDRPLGGSNEDNATDTALAILREPAGHSEEVIYRAACELSGYRLAEARFVKEYPDDVRTVVCRVLEALRQHHEKHCKTTFFEKCFGKGTTLPYTMFASAVFYRPERHADCEIELTPTVRFICRDGSWYRRTACAVRGKSRELGRILKAIDAAMRRAYDYKYPLKDEEHTKRFTAVLDKEIARLLEEKAASARPVIAIDVTKLSGIRRAAAQTRDSLLTEEDTEDTAPVSAAPPAAQTPAQKVSDGLPLTAEELELLSLLLSGGDAVSFARKRHWMPSVLADSINEKLFDLFGDTVIDCDADHYTLIEDYAEEVKERMSL